MTKSIELEGDLVQCFLSTLVSYTNKATDNLSESDLKEPVKNLIDLNGIIHSLLPVLTLSKAVKSILVEIDSNLIDSLLVEIDIKLNSIPNEILKLDDSKISTIKEESLMKIHHYLLKLKTLLIESK